MTLGLCLVLMCARHPRPAPFQKHRLLRKGQRVVDLGAAPGGFSEDAAKNLVPHKCARLVCVDLLDMKAPGESHPLKRWWWWW